MKSDGHRGNILSTKALQLGCGVYYRGGKFYATQNFQWFVKAVVGAPQDQLPSFTHTRENRQRTNE
ncbi:hypothetical protein HUU05_22365 [candidate division KSB1 bacterium]|nr:hypothetical protein [candidate division KSB1 bacterium]